MICQHDQPDQCSGLDDFCCVDTGTVPRRAGARDTIASASQLDATQCVRIHWPHNRWKRDTTVEPAPRGGNQLHGVVVKRVDQDDEALGLIALSMMHDGI